MFTRVIQGKRPRPLALLAILGALVAAGLFAAAALATLVNDTGTHDVTVANKESSSGLVSLGNASVEYIGSSANNQSSGTGIFDPFVRLQADPTEQGFNTDAAVTLDTKTGKWTHAIKVNAIPVVDCDGDVSTTPTCWELFVDINENNTAKRVSLNDVQIWFTDSATLSPYPFTDNGTTTTQEYHFSGAILINDVNQGSGRGDLRYLVPTAGHIWTADTYFVLYSAWGTTTGTAGTFGTGGYSSDGGFEEWKVRKTPNVSIVKTADAASVNAGESIGFTITVTNNGVADATGVTISDPLPIGAGLDWSEAPVDNPNCSISGTAPAQETLNCGPVTLAAGGGSLSVHVQSATTGASCGTYNNTATFTSTNAGSGSASASVTVNCAAIQVLKQSTKTGNPLVTDPTPADNTDNAVFTVTPPVGSAFDVTDNGAGDEDSTYGEVCVSGLAPGTYSVTEKTAPAGYGSGNPGFDTSAVAAAGTNCNGSHPATANSAIFRNPPLSDIQVRFRDGGSGETSATISCDNSTGTTSTADTTTWDDTTTVTGVNAPTTIVCTIVIDP